MFPSYRNQSVDLLANQLNGFYTMGTLVVKGLMVLQKVLLPVTFSHQDYCNLTFRSSLSETSLSKNRSDYSKRKYRKLRNYYPSLFRKSRKFRSSRLKVFCKKGALKNFAKFTEKHLRQSLFFKKVAGLFSLFLWKEF